jgi:hypothetical protein
MLCFFYDGVYKLVNWDQYGSYMEHAPLVNKWAKALELLIPGWEIGMAVFFMVKPLKIAALYACVVFNIAFIFWVAIVLMANHYVFFPFHAYWHEQTWLARMLVSLVLSWMAFLALFFIGRSRDVDNISNHNLSQKILPSQQRRTALIRD